MKNYHPNTPDWAESFRETGFDSLEVVEDALRTITEGIIIFIVFALGTIINLLFMGAKHGHRLWRRKL